MIYRYWIGWVLVTIVYFATLWLSLFLASFLFPDPKSGEIITNEVFKQRILFQRVFAGALMLTVPYAIAGIYAKKNFRNATIGALGVSIVPMVLERAIVYFVGERYASEMLHPGYDWMTVANFVASKSPAIYFSALYIVLGVASVLISIWIASRKKGIQTP